MYGLSPLDSLRYWTFTHTHIKRSDTIGFNSIRHLFDGQKKTVTFNWPYFMWNHMVRSYRIWRIFHICSPNQWDQLENDVDVDYFMDIFTLFGWLLLQSSKVDRLKVTWTVYTRFQTLIIKWYMSNWSTQVLKTL